MPVIGWVDTDTLSGLWPDSDNLATADLEDVLATAHEQCLEYLPPEARNPETVPKRYRLAQVMQAKALARATVVGSDDNLAGDGITVTLFPMDWTVKNLLRPKTVGRVL